jgi:hypothetical protein
MPDPVCLECARPILPGEAKSTVQQVDACTLAVEHLPYHSACWERKMGGARGEETGAG